jgi:hypothetical protein
MYRACLAARSGRTSPWILEDVKHGKINTHHTTAPLIRHHE